MSLLKTVMIAGLVGVVSVAGFARETSAARKTATSGAVTVADGALQSRIAASLKKSANLAPRDINVNVNQGVVKEDQGSGAEGR
jgi:osmotically-inducible protein OsmY